ncbi:hypothetical protein EON65_00900 [archaeon]|nr:MAG: hypothetical protein EON65_00900 [archaeon]
MGRRIEELVKAEDLLSDQVESLEKEGMGTMRRIRELEEEVLDLTATLQKQKEAYQDLRMSYSKDIKEYEQKMDVLNNKLDDMRKMIQKGIEERENLAEEHRNKYNMLQRDNDKLAIEKEQQLRDKQHLMRALTYTAQQIQRLIQQQEEEEKLITSKVDMQSKSTNYLLGEMRRLSQSVHSIIEDAQEQIRQSEEKRQQQVKITEALTAQHAQECEKFEQKVSELKTKLEAEEQKVVDLLKERTALQQEGMRQREEMSKLERELQEALDTAGKFNEEDLERAKEEERQIWKEKLNVMRVESEKLSADLKVVQQQFLESTAEAQKIHDSNVQLNDQLLRTSAALSEAYESCSLSLAEGDSKEVELDEKWKQKLRLAEEEWENERERLISNAAKEIKDLRPVSRGTEGSELDEPPIAEILPSTSDDYYDFPEVEGGRFRDSNMQTDAPAVPKFDEAAWVMSYDKVEEIVRKSIVTQNLFFSETTHSFTNAYPVEEVFLRDLIRAFYALSSGMTKLSSLAYKQGYDLAAMLINNENLLQHAEKLLLSTAQDLVIKLEKSKEDTMAKLKSDLLDQMQERVEEVTATLTTQHNHYVHDLVDKMNKERDTVEHRLNKKVNKLNTKLQDSYKDMEEKEKRLRQQFDIELKRQLDEITRNFSESEEDGEEEDTFGDFKADSSLLLSNKASLEEKKEDESSADGEAGNTNPSPPSLIRQSSASSRRHSSLGGNHGKRKASSKGGDGSGGMLTETMKLQYRQEIEDEIRETLQKEMLEKEKIYQKLGEEESKADDQGERLKSLLLQIDPNNEDVKVSALYCNMIYMPYDISYISSYYLL